MAPQAPPAKPSTSKAWTKKGIAKKSTTKKPTSRVSKPTSKTTRPNLLDKLNRRSVDARKGRPKTSEQKEGEQHAELTRKIAIDAHERASKKWGADIRFETIIPAKAHPWVILESSKGGEKNYKDDRTENANFWHPVILEHIACFAEAGATTGQTWAYLKAEMKARQEGEGEYAELEGLIVQDSAAALLKYRVKQGMDEEDVEEELKDIEIGVKKDQEAREQLTNPPAAPALSAPFSVMAMR